MRKQTKQVLALLLAVISLVGFAMPTVFATQGAGEPESSAPQTVTYQFYNADWKETSVANHTADIKAAYDAGTSNWRYEATNYPYQYSRNGHTFASGTTSMEFTLLASQWVAVRIKSPGAGTYDLTYAHGAKDQGAKKGSMYIIKADVIDNALGANAQTYADAIAADPYQENGSTAAYTDVNNAINTALAGKESVIDSDYYATSTQKNITDTGSFTFEADAEYVVVFKSVTKADGASTARLLLTSLTAAKAEEQEEEEPEETIPDPVTYQFYNDDWKETFVSAHTADIKSAYDAGNSNWRYEAASGAYQFNRNNQFSSGTQSLQYVTGASGWFAVRIKSPGAGKFDLTLSHGGRTDGTPNGSMYFIEASVIDVALGENAAAYAEAMSADPYQENGATDAFKNYFNVIMASIADKAPDMKVNYKADTSTMGLTSTGSFTFEADTEYVLVFEATKASETDTSTVYLLNTSLTATYAEEQEETEPGDAAEIETKVEITAGGITQVPESLKNVGMNTVADVNNALVQAVITQNNAINSESIANYDVKLMYTEDNGQTWIEADETHFPVSGKLEVTIPYPTGTNGSYTFTVAHMFTSSAFGKTPGDVETPAVTNTAAGIRFEVTGLSPITVGWTAPEPSDTTVYQFYNGEEDQAINNHIAQIKGQYDASALNWRYEAISNAYQFGRGGNTFASGSKSIEIMCAEGVWFAVRIKSPGAGMYDLTYTHGAGSNGARLGSMFIIKASDVDAELGENAASYAAAMSADPYQENGATDAFKAYVAAINKLIEGKTSVINSNYYTASTTSGLTDTGRFGFDADQEYVIVFKSVTKVAGESTARLLISSLTATYSADQDTGNSEAEEDNTPIIPENTVTDGLYDFYAGVKAGDTLADGIDTIAAMYEAGSLNWKYEAHNGVTLEKSSYSSGLKSMQFISTVTWWVAFRVKAPAQDGSYNIQMTHGAGGQGAVAGNIYVLPGDTATKDINKAMVKKGPAMTTDWFYGTNSGDVISDRQSGVGTVNMEAGKEYIIVFMPSEKSAVTNNAYMWLGQLQATRVGDMVDEPEDTLDPAGYYEFYHYDYPGQYLIHYKTEEELKAQIVTDVIAKEYDEGLINWKYEKSSGFANFVTGTPYMDATIGESYPLVLRIKSPGTGTYSIAYTHYATTSTSAADSGYVYIVEVPDKEYDYTYIRDECSFKDPIITTTYKADKNGFVTVTGEYTAFQEGKEYFLCFDVADADPAKKPSIHAYPQSMQMTRTGDYKPEPGKEPDDGTVYNLMLGDEYVNKFLWHSTDSTLYNEVTKRYENGILNWRLEAIGGSASYSTKYLKVGVGKEGGVLGFRIKSPGTGKYKVTLKYFLGNDIGDANDGEIYVVEAPENYVDGTYLADKMARAPITTATFSHTGNGLEKATTDGTYNFEEGKEYLIILYLSDITDTGNTTKSTWAYLDRFVLKRVGEFEPEPEHFNKGGIVSADANRLFRTAGSIAITEINGHDYLAMAVYGGTMMLYDLDEWRLIDEVLTGVPTPRGIAVDHDGKFWITGDTKSVYSYDPYTLTGEMHNLGLPGGSAYNITCGEDGYLYWSTYASTGAHLFRMNPVTMELTFHTYSGWSCFMADMDQKGDYIYAFVSGEERHELWKINKFTGKVVDAIDMTAEMLEIRYMDGVEFMDDNYLWMATSDGITIVDVRTMTKLPREEIGLEGVITRAISGELNGKRYFITSKEGLCYYDIATQTFGKVSGDVENARTALRGKDYNLATIDDERLPGTSIITFGGMGSEGVNLYAYNPENGAYVTLIGLVETSFAYGQDLREMGAGLPGSGEIYYGANYEAPVQVYNCLTNEEGRAFATNGQADAFHWYKDQLYIGNYNGAILTRMENGEPIALFRLNNDVFYQARIHTISSGDDKVFVGTVPHVYQNGGVLAWYDLNTELTYVVTGPNPEDVYYAKASKVTVTEQWYSAVTHELVDMEKEWDKDEDGDGVCKYFKGPIPLQSITKVVYRNGLIFGLAAPMGGTSAVNPAGATAKMFIYDVENMKMLKVFDIGDYISGLPYPLHALAAFEGDPEISNKFWGVVSETLFSMTYDFDTGKITIKEELSFDKSTIKNGNGWFCNDMLFQDEYIYVMLYKKGGLCRINRNNPKEYEQLLYNFDSTKDLPSSFVLADDGDLYYIAGTTLYVLNLDITEEERAIAKNVQDLIDIISDTVTMEDRPAIEAARAAWDAMAPANQPLVNNYQKLEEAEIELLRLRIAALGEITIEDEAELVAIRKTYSTLTLDQRMSIDFLTVSKAESIMSILRGERMVNIIAAIGEVTLEKETVVREARAAFMALSLYERKLVTNIDVLNAAEAVLNSLILERNEANAVDKLIDKIGFVFFGPKKVMDARKAYNKLSDYAKDLVEKHTTLVVAEIILVAEYLVAAAAVTGGVLYAIPTTRAKIFKKKEKATE